MKREQIIIALVVIAGVFLFFKLFKYFVLAAIIYGIYLGYKKYIKNV